ncbi:MAG: DUF924 family protein [Candidatus Binatia bacterium]
MGSFEDVLRFWFPFEALDAETAVRQVEWWFHGGADSEGVARFAPLLESAARGDLDSWKEGARSRLALIIVLDQFSRSGFRGTASLTSTVGRLGDFFRAGRRRK